MSDIYDLDFDTIKNKLKAFMAEKDEFKDYNFEGSALSSQIDIFAFATIYMGYYLNMSMNEMFLETAKIDENVYKISSGFLNYLPKRKSAPKIKCNFKRKDESNSVLIPKYTKFTINGADLILLEDLSLEDYNDHEIYLYQGNMITDEFTSTKLISDSDTFEKFTLTYRENIDNQIFYVYVDSYNGSINIPDGIEWKNVKEYPTVGQKRFYIDYNENMTIKFDSGSLYDFPIENDIIRVVYLRTDGSKFNGYSGDVVTGDNNLSINNLINDNIDITSLTVLTDGADEDSIADIKAIAPQYFVTQNRAVSESDYNILIKTWAGYDTLHSFKAWGGDKERIIDDKIVLFETNPSASRDLGHVYYTGLNTDFSRLTTDKQNEIYDFYDDKRIITIFLKWIDPVIIKINPTISIRKKELFGVTDNDIRNGIVSYLESIEGQEKSFHRSNFLRAVDGLVGVDYSDVSFTTSVSVLNNDNNVIRLFNQIAVSSISGTVNGFNFYDDGTGIIKFDDNGTIRDIGIVNYNYGFISLDCSACTNFIAIGEEFNFEFDYTNTHTFSLKKESFLTYDETFSVNYNNI